MNPIRIFSLAFAILLASCATQQAVQPVEGPQSLKMGVGSSKAFFFAGAPEAINYPNDMVVLQNTGYVVGFDETRGVPAWAGYRVFAVDSYESDPRPSRFKTDKRVSKRITHDTYTNSSYDRGHMAPNFAIATRYGNDAQVETFFMTNVAPQTQNLNQQWWQRLELLIAKDFSENYDQVWVTVGPVFHKDDQWIGDEVEIPACFFQVITAKVDGKTAMLAFLVPQDVPPNDPHAPYLVSVQQVEQATGLNFNPELSAAQSKQIESTAATRLWLTSVDDEMPSGFKNKCLD